jgi:recombination protein RecT
MSTTNQLRAAATGQATPAPKTIYEYLEDPRVKQGIAAVAGKFLTPDRMLRLCVMAVKKTPKLAACDPTTVLGAMMTSAALGLEPNTVQQQAFLIPYNSRRKVGNQWVDVLECQFQIGYRGFLTLAYRSPQIQVMQADAIHEHDAWDHTLGSQTMLRYSKSLRERGALIGAFSWARLEGAGESACVLPLEELHKIRSRSETYRALLRGIDLADNDQSRAKAELKLAETPWVMWEDDMAAKSAIKKHAKMLPIASNDALAVAAEIDARGESGALDLRSMTSVEQVRDVVDEGGDPPALEDHSDAQAQSREAFATTQRREAVPAEPAQTPAAAPAAAKRTTRAAAPAASPSQAPAQGPTYAQLADDLQKCSDRDAGLEVLDLARDLPDDQMRDLRAVFSRKFPE